MTAVSCRMRSLSINRQVLVLKCLFILFSEGRLEAERGRVNKRGGEYMGRGEASENVNPIFFYPPLVLNVQKLIMSDNVNFPLV